MVDDGITALHRAAWGGHTAVVSALLGAGADPNAGDNFEGWTALYSAAWGGHSAVVSALPGAD